MPQEAVNGFGGEDSRLRLAVGALRGFRAWYVPAVVTPYLKSMSWNYFWSTGENVAECRARGKVTNASKCKAEHHPNSYQHVDACPRHAGCAYPRRNCACGFYAFSTEDYWLDNGRPWPSTAYLGTGGGTAPVISGVVEGYGRMVVGGKGFRAQKAVIAGLALPIGFDIGWLAQRQLTVAEATDLILDGFKGLYPGVPIFPSVKDLLAELPLTNPKAG